MPNFTKRAIREAFLRQLAQRPLNQITVKDIVEECGINRNSFYYHYEGIPALLEEIIAGELDRLTKAYPNIDSMEQGVDAAVEFICANKRAVLHIYNSLSRDVFERYLMDICRYIADSYVKAEFMGKSLSEEDLQTLIRFHKCECFGSVIDWLNGGMKDDIADYFRRVCALQKSWVAVLGN